MTSSYFCSWDADGYFGQFNVGNSSYVVVLSACSCFWTISSTTFHFSLVCPKSFQVPSFLLLAFACFLQCCLPWFLFHITCFRCPETSLRASLLNIFVPGYLKFRRYSFEVLYTASLYHNGYFETVIDLVCAMDIVML